MNNRTLVAAFPDHSTAHQAARELEGIGVPADAIQVNSSQQTTTVGSSSYGNAQQHESGFAGWWHSLFGSEHDQDERAGYESAIAGGGAVLTATVPSEHEDRAVDILNRYGTVEDGGRETTTRRAESLTSNPAAGRTTGTTDRTTGTGQPLQVVEEELEVGKRAVQRGGVRVYTHVVNKPVEQEVRLREEHVTVDRHPVNREINPAELSGLRDQTIEVTEMAEEAVIGKRARVVEEVVVGKQATERVEKVRENVRRSEVQVEQLGTQARTAGQDYTAEYRKNFESTYGPDGDFETMRPAYEYGYTAANDQRFQGRSWSDVESTMRSDYESRYPGNAWDRAKNAVRYGWERVTGQR